MTMLEKGICLQWCPLVYSDLPTLDHTILIDKLYYYGVQGMSLDLLRSYLVKRKQ